MSLLINWPACWIMPPSEGWNVLRRFSSTWPLLIWPRRPQLLFHKGLRESIAIGLLEHYSCPGIRLRHVPIHLDLIADHSLLTFSTRSFRLEFSGFICMSVEFSKGQVNMCNDVWFGIVLLYISFPNISNTAFKQTHWNISKCLHKESCSKIVQSFNSRWSPTNWRFQGKINKTVFKV